jgi:hypothetical protein
MAVFSIIETDDGLLVVEHPESMSAEETASRHGGVVIDENPYPTYDEAYDALLALQRDADDDAEPVP